MKKFFKKWNKERTWLSWLILSLTIVGVIVSIALGSIFYVAKTGNVRKSIEYDGGYELLANISSKKDNSGVSESTAEGVESNLDSRLRANGLTNPLLYLEGENRNWDIRVLIPGIKSKDDEDTILSTILHQPIISIYDKDNIPLFGKTSYNSDKSIVRDIDQLQVIKSDSAHYTISGGQNPKNIVALEMNGQASQDAMRAATTELSKENSQRGNEMYIWLDHDDLETLIYKYATGFHRVDFLAIKGNLNLFAHNLDKDHKPSESFRQFTWYGDGHKESDGKTLWYNLPGKHVINFGDFLISSAKVTKPLAGKNFEIDGSFSIFQAKQLASNINFGLATYKLVEKSSHFVNPEYGSSSFEKAILAGLVVFSFISIFMILNYGLLGALSTISLGLYLFITLMLFTSMRGEYSPETIGALILGIGMGIDANIITFERIKRNIFKRESIKKSNLNANNLSISTILDSNITTILIALILFYFGTHSIQGFSIMLIISIAFTLLIMLLFTRFLTWLLIRTNVFNNNLILLGIRKKSYDKFNNSFPKYENWNYIKNSKWFVLLSGIILFVSVIVFSIVAGLAGNISSGFNRSLEFSGGSVVSMSSKDKITSNEFNTAKQFLNDHGITDIDALYNVQHELVGIEGKTDTHSISSLEISQFKNKTAHWIEKKSINNVTNVVAQSMIKNAMYAILIAFAAIVVYTLIRFRWTFSVSSILALVHDGLIVTAVFIIFRIQFSPIFIAALLSIIGYSINDTIVTFDRIRELLKKENKKFLDKKDIVRIANTSIGQTIKRSFLTVFTTLSAIIILMCFVGATDMRFNIAMLVGLISGTYSSIFIATYSWVYLELFRQKRMKKRYENKFWETKGVEEQTIKGVNDFEY